MPTANPALYRYTDFIGGSILDAQNVISVETQELTRAEQGLGSLYQVGTLLNAVFIVSGSTITLQCANNTYPILVFVRGTFEQLVSAGGSVTLPAIPYSTVGTYNFYLNYSIDIITSAQDGTLVDGTTGQPTVEMGQLDMTMSWIDNSATSLNSSIQFEKNTSPIILVKFAINTALVISAVYINGVYPYALANTSQSGLVTLTDNTGIAVGTNDPRMSGTRGPTPGSVFNSSVAPLIVTNPSTTPVQYDQGFPGQGGIFTDSIIYTTLKQRLTDFLDNVQSAITSAIASLAAHIGQPLGTTTTHPFPTALQVGATPLSHVGQALGLSTSHPASVNSDTAGFTVNEVTTSVSGDAYGVYSNVSARKGALTHTGEVYSVLANSSNAQGDNGTGGSATNRGTLGNMSLIAAVLAEHVNYTSHGNNNPHNMNAADIGAASTAYVNSQVSSGVATAEAYAAGLLSFATRVVTTNGGGWAVNAPVSWAHNYYANEFITYVIFTINGSFELAIGTGFWNTGEVVPLPEVSGWSGGNWLGSASIGWSYQIGQITNTTEMFMAFYVDPGTRTVTAHAQNNDPNNGYNNVANTPLPGVACINAYAWRTI